MDEEYKPFGSPEFGKQLTEFWESQQQKYPTKVECEWVGDPMVDKPKHYCIGRYELIDFLDELSVHGEYSALEWGYVISILQYLCRAPKKNGLQDYKKAQFYLNRLIKKIEGKESK